MVLPMMEFRGFMKFKPVFRGSVTLIIPQASSQIASQIASQTASMLSSATSSSSSEVSLKHVFIIVIPLHSHVNAKIDLALGPIGKVLCQLLDECFEYVIIITISDLTYLIEYEPEFDLLGFLMWEIVPVLD